MLRLINARKPLLGSYASWLLLHRRQHDTAVAAAGVEQGLEEDFLVAVELGATSKEQLTEAQLEYADKIKEKLAKVCQLVGAAVCANLERDQLQRSGDMHKAARSSQQSGV